jgi:uncharacterized protein
LAKLAKIEHQSFFSSDLLHVERLHKNLGKANISIKAHPGGPCIPGARRPMVDYKGDIFPCERVSETSDAMIIGNIYKGFDIKKAENVLNIGRLTKSECVRCWNFAHCGMCASAADDNSTLSREKKLSYCENSKRSTLNLLYTVCILTEFGYDFKGGYLDVKSNYDLPDITR